MQYVCSSSLAKQMNFANVHIPILMTKQIEAIFFPKQSSSSSGSLFSLLKALRLDSHLHCGVTLCCTAVRLYAVLRCDIAMLGGSVSFSRLLRFVEVLSL